MTVAKQTPPMRRESAFLPGFEARWVDARAVRMRYFVGGEGAPLALVHGLSGAASEWVELAPALARKRRVIVPELPGHGGSDALPAAPNLNGFADRVRLALEAEDALPAPIVGHSLGASIALRLALRWPDDVRGVVLAASAGIASSTRAAQFWLALAGFVRPGMRIAPHRRRLARSARLRRIVFWHWGASDPAAMSGRGAEGLLAAPEHHADTLSASRALVRDDPRVDLDGVRCPVLVLWGARDNQVPVDDGFQYARRLRAPLRVVPDCGHLLVVERPDACLHAIGDFLTALG
jgi:3-oxoadipate enol-lactonase